MNWRLAVGALTIALAIVSCTETPQRPFPAHLATLRAEWVFHGPIRTMDDRTQASRKQESLARDAVAQFGLARLADDVLDASTKDEAEQLFLWELSSHLFYIALDDRDWQNAADILARMDDLPLSGRNIESVLVIGLLSDEEVVARIEILLCAFERATSPSQRKALGDTLVRAFGRPLGENDPVVVVRKMRATLQRPLGTIVPNRDYPPDWSSTVDGDCARQGLVKLKDE